MLLHKLLQQILLLLLITSRFPHLLLPLIKHHLLHHAARRPVQIAELAVLGRDFGRVDFGRRGDHMGPPFHLVGLFEVDRYFLSAGRGF